MERIVPEFISYCNKWCMIANSEFILLVGFVCVLHVVSEVGVQLELLMVVQCKQAKLRAAVEKSLVKSLKMFETLNFCNTQADYQVH